MATPNRAALLTRLQKVLRKHYKPVPTENRSVLEHLVFACCLENAHYEPAQQAFNALRSIYFDWNEIRVTSVKELSEVLKMLPDPATSSQNVKKILYGIFESTYSFDLESLKKLNLGQALQKIKKFEGATPFVMAYVTQATLGGHAIPLDRGTLEALRVVNCATEQEMKESTVTGLERAIPKNKGIEFGSLLHQLGADLVAGPLSPNLHKILLEIDPECKDRLPKRRPKAPPPPPPAPPKPLPKPVIKKLPPPPAPPAKKAPEPAKKAPEIARKPAESHKKPTEKVAEKKLPPKPIAKKKPVAPVTKRKPR